MRGNEEGRFGQLMLTGMAIFVCWVCTHYFNQGFSGDEEDLNVRLEVVFAK